MTTAAELYALQETDLAMDSAVARLNEVEAQLGETEELVSARELVEQRRGETHQVQERQKGLDWDAEEVRRKALELEGAWKAGQASLTETQAALKGEIQDLEAKRSRQLDGMDGAALGLYEVLR